jgi:hypothetical protein
VRDELEYVVIVGQAARSRRHTEVTALGQHHILSPDTQLEILSKGRSKYIALLQNNIPDHVSSVADPGCLSQIPDLDFCPSRIPDLGSRPKTATKEKGEKNYFPTFFVALNMTKLKIILFLSR